MEKEKFLEAQRLRNEGLSFGKIGIILGITKSQANYLCKTNIENVLKSEKEKKEFEENVCCLAKICYSLTEVCNKLGKLPTNTNLEKVKNVINKYNVETPFFTKKYKNYSYTKSKPIEEYLKYGSKIPSTKLRNKLIKEKIKEYRCERCKNTEWLGKKIPLQLHHIDGDKNNNCIENLQLLCPNCHSLTENFCGKNVKRKKIKTKEKQENKQKKQLPSKEDIINSFKKHGSYIKVGKDFNVSDKTIVNWCFKLGLPTKSLDFRKYIKENFSDYEWKITKGNPNGFKKK